MVSWFEFVDKETGMGSIDILDGNFVPPGVWNEKKWKNCLIVKSCQRLARTKENPSQ